MSMTPEELTHKLYALCGDNLKSVILYGSAAAGDHLGRHSNYNIIAILGRLNAQDLRNLGGSVEAWMKNGNPAPIFISWQDFQKSDDTFPIEMMDMKEHHKILHGQNPFNGFSLNADNLRIELEHELKSKAMTLRTRFILTRGRSKEIQELVIESLSAFLVLFRATLRLYGEKIPAHKIDILPLLRKHIDFDDEVFRQAAELKTQRSLPDFDPIHFFERYLDAIEKVTQVVDDWKQSPQKNK